MNNKEKTKIRSFTDLNAVVGKLINGLRRIRNQFSIIVSK